MKRINRERQGDRKSLFEHSNFYQNSGRYAKSKEEMQEQNKQIQ